MKYLVSACAALLIFALYAYLSPKAEPLGSLAAALGAFGTITAGWLFIQVANLNPEDVGQLGPEHGNIVIALFITAVYGFVSVAMTFITLNSSPVPLKTAKQDPPLVVPQESWLFRTWGDKDCSVLTTIKPQAGGGGIDITTSDGRYSSPFIGTPAGDKVTTRDGTFQRGPGETLTWSGGGTDTEKWRACD